MNNPVEVRAHRARVMTWGAIAIIAAMTMGVFHQRFMEQETGEEPLTVLMVIALNGAEAGDAVIHRDGRVCLVEEHPKGSGLLKMKGRACDQGRMRIMTLAGSVAHVLKKDSPEYERVLGCLGIVKFEETGRKVDYSKWHC